MNKLGRSLLVQDKIITPEETVEMLSHVTQEDIQKLAERLFLSNDYTVTVLGPLEDVSFSL